MNVGRIVLPAPGRYTVRLVYNHTMAQEFTLTAKLVEPPWRPA